MKLWVRFAISVAVLGLLFVILPWREVVGSMGRIRWTVWLGIVAGFLGGHALGVIKWRLIINAGRGGLKLKDAVGCYAAGLFANLCLPSIVGGDVLRAVLAGKKTSRPEAVVIGGLADRASDVLALTILITGGALLAGQVLPGTWQLVLIVVIGLAGLAASTGVILVLRRPLTSWPPRIRRRLGRTLVALRRLVARPGTALAALLLSLTIQASFVTLSAIIGDAIGIAQPLSVWFLAWPVAKLSGLLPISLGGLAIREATLAAMLAPFGVAPALGVAASLLWQTVLIAGGLLSGLVWLLYRGRGFRRLAPDPGNSSVARVEHG